MIITVKRVEAKESKEGKKYRRIEDTKGRWYSVWDGVLFGLFAEGTVLKIETETKGDFTNIILAEEAEPKEAQKENSKENSIERQTCLKAAAELALANATLNQGKTGIMSAIQVVNDAAILLAWLQEGLLPTLPDTANPDSARLLQVRKELNLTVKQVQGILKVLTLPEYLESGKTVDDAIAALRKAKEAESGNQL